MQVDKLDIRSGTYRIHGYASLDADEILISNDGNFVGIGEGANPKIFNAVIRKESGVLSPGSLAVEGVTFASDLRVVEQLQFHGDLRLAEGATLNVNGRDAQVFHWPFEEAGNLVGNGKIVVQGGSLSATKLQPV